MINIRENFKHVFEADLLEEIEKNGKITEIEGGDFLIKSGQTVRTFPIILEGTIKISRQDEDGREIFLYYVSSQESCALTFTCCMQHKVSEISAVAQDKVILCAIPVRYMDEWMSRYASWRSYAMLTVQERFNELLRTIDQVAFRKLDDRLVDYLKEKQKQTGSALVNHSHEQIAKDLATSRVVISRLLKKLEQDGKVLLYRNQLKIMKGL